MFHRLRKELWKVHQDPPHGRIYLDLGFQVPGPEFRPEVTDSAERSGLLTKEFQRQLLRHRQPDGSFRVAGAFHFPLDSPYPNEIIWFTIHYGLDYPFSAPQVVISGRLNPPSDCVHAETGEVKDGLLSGVWCPALTTTTFLVMIYAELCDPIMVRDSIMIGGVSTRLPNVWHIAPKRSFNEASGSAYEAPRCSECPVVNNDTTWTKQDHYVQFSFCCRCVCIGCISRWLSGKADHELRRLMTPKQKPVEQPFTLSNWNLSCDERTFYQTQRMTDGSIRQGGWHTCHGFLPLEKNIELFRSERTAYSNSPFLDRAANTLASYNPQLYERLILAARTAHQLYQEGNENADVVICNNCTEHGTCSVIPTPAGATQVQGPTCKLVICVTCNVTPGNCLHTARTDEKLPELCKLFLAANSIVPCPNCRLPAGKDPACIHVACRECDSRYCFACGLSTSITSQPTQRCAGHEFGIYLKNANARGFLETFADDVFPEKSLYVIRLAVAVIYLRAFLSARSGSTHEGDDQPNCDIEAMLQMCIKEALEIVEVTLNDAGRQLLLNAEQARAAFAKLAGFEASDARKVWQWPIVNQEGSVKIDQK